MIIKKNITNISYILVILLPFSLLTGPFVPDLLISLITINFFVCIYLEKNYKYIKNRFFLFLISFYIYLLVNSLISNNTYQSLGSSLFYFRFIIFPFAIWFLIDERKNLIKYFAVSLFLSFTLAIISGFYQYIYNINIFGIVAEYDFRLTLLFSDEMVLGHYFSRLFPLLFAVLLISFKNNKKFYIVLGSLFILTDILVYLSGERTSVALLLLSVIFLIITMKKFRNLRMISLALSVLIITILTFSIPELKKRNIDNTLNQLGISDLSDENNELITDSTKFSDYSKFLPKNLFSNYHEKLIFTSWNIFIDNKLFGAGVNTYRLNCKLKIYKADDDSCSTHPHHTYIQILSELGIIGFLFLLIAIFFLCFKILILQKENSLKQTQINYDYKICLIMCFLITFFPFLPTLNFFNNWINIIYYLPLGFYLHENYKNREVVN